MSNLIVVNENNFDSVIKNDDKVIIELGATWCHKCKAMLPMMENLAMNNSELKICTLDIDDCPNICTTYKIKSVPTFLIFDNGNLINQHSGTVNESELLNMLV